jgi:hypothetical protein
MVWPGLDWPLLTNGHSSEVVVKTGWTVLCICKRLLIVVIGLMLSLSLCLLVVKEGHLTCVVPNESKRNYDNDQNKCK